MLRQESMQRGYFSMRCEEQDQSPRHGRSLIAPSLVVAVRGDCGDQKCRGVEGSDGDGSDLRREGG